MMEVFLLFCCNDENESKYSMGVVAVVNYERAEKEEGNRIQIFPPYLCDFWHLFFFGLGPIILVEVHFMAYYTMTVHALRKSPTNLRH